MSQLRWVSGEHPNAENDSMKDDVLRYLQSAQVIYIARGLAQDQVDPSRGAVVPILVATDGEWVWDGRLEYNLEVHNLWPEANFVTRAVELAGSSPKVSQAAIGEVQAWLASQQ